ncbi:MAG: STAS domain-containing protein [Solirubrobacteraceae bacterium]
MSEFQINTEETEFGATLKLAGKLDGATADVVVAQFDRAVDAGCQRLTVDLAGVSFIDSAGLRGIIVIQRRATERDLSLTVVPPPRPLLDLLEITGLTERLALAPQEATPLPEQRFLERVNLELRRDPQAPGQARGEVRQAIERRLNEVELATAVLLTSELVTNAVVHPPPDDSQPIELRISSYPDRVRVEVFDSGGGFRPEALPKSPTESGGRGLMVVEQLASRWGIDHGTDGGRFCVWYELEPESAEA